MINIVLYNTYFDFSACVTVNKCGWMNEASILCALIRGKIIGFLQTDKAGKLLWTCGTQF